MDCITRLFSFSFSQDILAKESSRHDTKEDPGSGQQRAFHCDKCDVYLKNESAFKSHNSKLHLQRSERTFYCRVCDKIFGCRVEHRAHIRTHRIWKDEPGLQVMRF